MNDNCDPGTILATFNSADPGTVVATDVSTRRCPLSCSAFCGHGVAVPQRAFPESQEMLTASAESVKGCSRALDVGLGSSMCWAPAVLNIV